MTPSFCRERNDLPKGTHRACQADLRRKGSVSVWGLIAQGLIDRQERKPGCGYQRLAIEKTGQPQVSPDVTELKLTNTERKSFDFFV